MKFVDYLHTRQDWRPQEDSEEESYEYAKGLILQSHHPDNRTRIMWRVTYEPLYVIRPAGVMVGELPESLRSDS